MSSAAVGLGCEMDLSPDDRESDGGGWLARLGGPPPFATALLGRGGAPRGGGPTLAGLAALTGPGGRCCVFLVPEGPPLGGGRAPVGSGGSDGGGPLGFGLPGPDGFKAGGAAERNAMQAYRAHTFASVCRPWFRQGHQKQELARREGWVAGCTHGLLVWAVLLPSCEEQLRHK